MSKRRTSDLANKLRPYLQNSAAVAAAAVSGGVTDHGLLSGLSGDDHPQYLTAARGDSRYIKSGEFPSSASHNVTDHTATGSQYDLVGLTATDTLGIITPASDASAGNTILITDANGAIEVDELATDSIVADGNLTITPVTNLFLSPTGDNIITDANLRSNLWISGTSTANTASVDFGTGIADFRSMTADELVVTAFIAKAYRAYFGGLRITPSMSTLTRDFTIPTAGNSGTLYVADLPGFGDMDTFAAGHDASISYMSLSEPYSPNWGWIDRASDNGTGGATVHYAEEDFEGYTAGDDPTDWRDTGTSNSMTLSDLCDVQSVGGTKAFGTAASGSNFHTHYDGTGSQALTNYRFTGRVRIGSSSVGAGFTLFSQYESGGTDEYYRIRRYSGNQSFHVANHGSVASTMTGDTTSGYNPAANVWHQFKIEVENNTTDSRTEVRAKFWQDGTSEPATWQIDCYDDTANRQTTGTFGLWFYQATDGAYMDDLKVEALTGTSSGFTLYHNVLTDDVIIVMAICTTAATFTPAAGWTLIDSQATGSNTAYWYRYTAVSDGVVTSTWAASTGAIDAQGIAVRGLDTADIVEATSKGSYSSTTGASVTGVTVASDRTGLLLWHAGDTGEVTSIPTGMLRESERFSYYSTGIFSETVDSGATGARTFGLSASGSGAYLLIALNPKSGTRAGLSVGTAWGVLTAASPGDEENDEQAWTWTTNTDSSGGGETVYIDGVVQEYGETGDGYIEMTTLDASGSPYFQVVTRGDNPRIEQTVQLRAGHLGGVSDAQGTWGLYVQGSEGWLELSDSRTALVDVPLRMYEGTDEFLSITASRGIELSTGSVDEPRTTAITWYDANEDNLADIYAWSSGGIDAMMMKVVTDNDTSLTLTAYGRDAAQLSLLTLESGDGYTGYDARIYLATETLLAQAEEIHFGDGTYGFDFDNTDDSITLRGDEVDVIGLFTVNGSGATFSAPTIAGFTGSGGGSGTFSAQSVAAVQTNFLGTGAVTYHAYVSYVIRSGSSAISGTAGIDVNSYHTTASVNSITVRVGVGSGGALYTVRDTGSNAYDITVHAIWR